MTVRFVNLAPAVFLAIGLCACVATRHAAVPEQCTFDLQAGWRELKRPPAVAQELLDVETDGKTARSRLGPLPSGMVETWIVQDEIIRYCRFTPNVDACAGHARSIDFRHASYGWIAAGPALESICLD